LLPPRSTGLGRHNAIWFFELFWPEEVIKLVDKGVGIEKITSKYYNTIENITLHIGGIVIETYIIWVKLVLATSTSSKSKNVVWNEHANIKTNKP
jgi:hypothetical protein